MLEKRGATEPYHLNMALTGRFISWFDLDAEISSRPRSIFTSSSPVPLPFPLGDLCELLVCPKDHRS